MSAPEPVGSLPSIPDVCEVAVVTSPGSSPGRPTALIEVPHGATKLRHFEATRRDLKGEFPDDLEAFFCVNTDVGSIECARWIARMITDPASYPELVPDAAKDGNGKLGERESAGFETVLIVRGLVARTFVDLNRVLDAGSSQVDEARRADARDRRADARTRRADARTRRADARTRRADARSRLTGGFPVYVTHPHDIEILLRKHAEYQAVAAGAYEQVLGDRADGLALTLHTYAPRSVDIHRIDHDIVAALRRAYEPDVFSTLPRRPDVDLITESVAGSQSVRLAPESLAASVREHYAGIGIEATENATYRLHESSMGYVHSAKHPGRVLCVEINRELLADPFTPFEEMTISDVKARRMAAPLAAALLEAADDA